VVDRKRDRAADLFAADVMRWTPKPAQAECKRCERLFCYFQIAARRVFCSQCVEIDRREQNEFLRVQRRGRRIVSLRDEYQRRVA
jgi:late competence protein required for DNA uptake (superfamily II DNA/RNA helicase)